MTIRNLIPWKKNDQNIDVPQKQEIDNSLNDFRDQMNMLFDEFFERPFGLSPLFSESYRVDDFSPRLDVSESEGEITIAVELPGINQDDIEIFFENGYLTLRGEKRAEAKESNKHFYRVERKYGSFSRAIPINCEILEEKIQANFQNGLLKITLPKSQASKEKIKRIEVKTN